MQRYAKFKQKLDRNAQNVRDMAQALHIKTQGTFSRTQTTQVRDIAVALERIESPRLPEYSDSDTGLTLSIHNLGTGSHMADHVTSDEAR